MAEKHDLEIDAGATYQEEILEADSSGTYTDWTGYSAMMQVRESLNGDVKFSFLTDTGGGIVCGVSSVALTFAAASTAVMARGVYDLKLESPGAIVTRLIEGGIVINPAVTR